MEIRIPTLETERLILRPFREEDVEPLFELMQDPDVVRYIGDRQLPSRQDCWRAVAGWIGHWALRGYGLWSETGCDLAITAPMEPKGADGDAGLARGAQWPPARGAARCRRRGRAG